jgi:rRNA maturation endonuclease Nob1
MKRETRKIMKVSKMHFEMVARVLRERREFLTDDLNIAESAQRAELNLVALAFASEFKRENPRFDRERFLKACGFGDDYAESACEICGNRHPLRNACVGEF